MLEPSPRLRKEANRIGCEPNHVILADLILNRYTEAEAYDIAYSEDISMGAKQKIAKRERVLASEGYKRALDVKKKEREFLVKDIEYRDKDDVLRELNSMASKETDTKMRADLLMKIAEIKQMKKDATADDNDPVQFFFSLSCERCPFLRRFNEAITLKNDGLPQEKWDMEVRPDEMQRLIEQAGNDVREMRAKEKASRKGQPK